MIVCQVKFDLGVARISPCYGEVNNLQFELDTIDSSFFVCYFY